ncbi:helix-turn-helix domain-containing protein [Paenarthrobacter sp. NPDC090522]|uniref:helix-turn-helix domain-containing protein n=1 Tax=Paenarthrobacter sp. NPDC090522 TaxID=3364383 RepID=UPI003808703D
MAGSVIDLERFQMDRGQKFHRHMHDEHQLVWASSGVLMVDVDERYWVLPSTLALWIPAGVWHGSMALRDSVMEGIYLEPSQTTVAWSEPTIVAVSPLASHLIHYLAEEMEPSARTHAENVLLNVLKPANKAAIELRQPRDNRARDIADLLTANPADKRGIEELARVVGSSPRTLLRLFVAETGMTFAQWRLHARLQAAMGFLAEGHSVAGAAYRVGYANPSAFVAAFHRSTGHTPAAYFGGDQLSL